MKKRVLLMLVVIFVCLTACVGRRNSEFSEIGASYEIISESSEVSNVNFVQSQTLPPYGIRVPVEAVVLELRVSSSQRDADEKLADIRSAIDHLTLLASENETISLEDISVGQVGGSYSREEASTSNIQNLDTSVVTFKLAIDLAENDADFMGSIVEFNDFLSAIDLPDSLKVQALSVEAQLGDLEAYRSQLISQVYRELDLVQQEYGQPVKFAVSGLYDPLKVMQLSDTEYYIYLEPIVNVSEF